MFNHYSELKYFINTNIKPTKENKNIGYNENFLSVLRYHMIGY